MKVAPQSTNEHARLTALASYQLLDTSQERDYDELTELAAEICQTPVALITLIDENRQWFKSRYGTQIEETSRDIAFCSHTILQEHEIMIVPNTKEDERFRDNPMVTGESNVMFYAGVPLINPQGYALGTICVIGHEAKQLSDFQKKALKTLGKQVLNQMELKRKIQEAQDSNETLLESYTFIEKFAECAAHDIKNPLSNIILTAQALRGMLVKLGDARALRLVEITLDAGKSLTNYINELLRYSKCPSVLQLHHEDFELVDMLKKALNLIEVPDNCKIGLPEHPIHLKGSRIALEQIFLNLLTNAVRYNDKSEPKIRITFSEDDHMYHFQVKDNGKGISAENQLRIFEKGFISEEPDRYNKRGNGIGMNIIKSLVDKLRGTISISSKVGIGTTFYIVVPKHITANSNGVTKDQFANLA